MDYEFRSIVLESKLKRLTDSHNEELNSYFKDGWEYVDIICQSTSTGTESKSHGAVLVILRKKTE